MNAEGLKWLSPIVVTACIGGIGCVIAFSKTRDGFKGVEEWAESLSDSKKLAARQSIIEGIKSIHGISDSSGEDATKALEAVFAGLEQWRWLKIRRSYIGWSKFLSVWCGPTGLVSSGYAAFQIYANNDQSSSSAALTASLVVCAVWVIGVIPFIYLAYHNKWS